MSPKRNNGKVQQVVSPVKFNAGGNKMNSPSSSNKNNNNNNSSKKKKKNVAAVQSSTLSPQTDYQWIKSGLQKKQSPLVLKHWIATVLTLDGRDKFTKILQYSSRLLGWYFAGLAASSARSSSGADGIIAISQQQQQIIIIYQALSTRFTSLYKSLVTSRKAFRMGRWVIEWDKIRSMGWGEYLAYWLCHPLTEGVGRVTLDDEEGMTIDGRGGGDDDDDQGQLLVRLDTHPIPEENEEDDDDISWNGEEPSSSSNSSSTVEEKKDDTAAATTAHPQHSEKVISRPERPILPSRISSNIGWGPSNTTAVENVTSSSSSSSSKAHHHHHPSPPPPPRTVSEMGRQMYRPYPSQSSTSFGSYQQLKGTTSSTLAKQTSSPPPPPPTPAWKLIGGTLKLLGLMGFWAFDNLSFLTSSGFLDPIPSSSSTSSSSGGGDSKSTNAATIRTKRKQRASEYAARCYFMGGLAGLYVNLRSFWIHRNGALMEARRKYESSSAAATTTTSSDGKDSDDDGSSTRQALKKIEQQHFELFLALLKSICDVMVFSNNPGIDLHLKLRGKKNHEGFHCLCGLISAGTVLYNNFPNAE